MSHPPDIYKNLRPKLFRSCRAIVLGPETWDLLRSQLEVRRVQDPFRLDGIEIVVVDHLSYLDYLLREDDIALEIVLRADSTYSSKHPPISFEQWLNVVAAAPRDSPSIDLEVTRPPDAPDFIRRHF